MTGIEKLGAMVERGDISADEAAMTMVVMNAIAEFHAKYGDEKVALILLSILSMIEGVTVVRQVDGAPAGGPCAEAN